MKTQQPLLWLMLLSQLVWAQDSLVITGQIENLTARMHRAADAVQVTRVNLLRGRDEITYVAPLNTDGTFSVKVPLIAPTEECMLVYGRWVNSPFLAQKGAINVRIVADSLRKDANPLFFEGTLASTNNRRTLFERRLADYISEKSEFKNITKKLDRRTPTQAWLYLGQLRDIKTAFFERMQRNKPQDELLNTWVKSSIEEATKASFYDFLQFFGHAVPATLHDSIKIQPNTLHTFARVDALQQFFKHLINTTTTEITSLKASSMASLMLRYTSGLTTSERSRLEEIVRKNVIM